MWNRFLITVLFASLFLGQLRAQENVITELPRFVIEGNMIGIIPTGPAQKFLPEFSFGGEAMILYRIQFNKPILLGFLTQVNTFDRSHIEEQAEYDDGTFFTQRETTASHLWSNRAIFRFQPEINWLLQPYLQGSVGLNHYFTNTKFKDQDANEVFETNNEQKSTVFTYGIKAGLHFVPTDWYWRIHAGIGYLRNASTDFLSFDKNSQAFYPIEKFETINSPIDFLTVHIGALYLF